MNDPTDHIRALDDALHRGWLPETCKFSARQESILSAAMALADGRSESPLETHLRLLLVRVDQVRQALAPR